MSASRAFLYSAPIRSVFPECGGVSHGFETLIVNWLVSLAAKMNIVILGNVYTDDDDFEDKINTIIEGKKMAQNASYFAFTATPKNKTLEMFGEIITDENGNPILNEDGTKRAKPHDVYTMKQAIEEKFILDVLKYYPEPMKQIIHKS